MWFQKVQPIFFHRKQNRIRFFFIFSCFWRFLGAHFPYKSYRLFIKICDSKKFNRFFFIEKKSFRSKFLVFVFLSYLIPNPCKWHHVTPSRPPVRQKKNFFPQKSRSERYLGTSFLAIHCRAFSESWYRDFPI